MRGMASTPDLMTLIAHAPWREAVTYRETWPHEYVVVQRDGQEALLAAVCARIARGEGVECRFFGQTRRYLFLGDHKYWTMTECRGCGERGRVTMPLTTTELESKLWGAADILRGQIDSSDYKNYIFSVLFLKRLSDRFAEEVERAVADGQPLERCMRSQFYQRWVASMCRVGAQPNINAAEYSSLRIPLPPLNEQQAIVAVLDGVDGAIERAREERALLLSLKASAADALLTGRVRVARSPQGEPRGTS